MTFKGPFQLKLFYDSSASSAQVLLTELCGKPWLLNWNPM